MNKRIIIKGIKRPRKIKPSTSLADELKKITIATLFCNELSLEEMEALRDLAFFKKVPNV